MLRSKGILLSSNSVVVGFCAKKVRILGSWAFALSEVLFFWFIALSSDSGIMGYSAKFVFWDLGPLRLVWVLV